MKKIIIPIIAIIFFASCEKKHDYECKIFYPKHSNPEIVQKKCTEKQINKFIDKTEIDSDGVESTYNKDVDVLVDCIKK